MYFPKPVYKKRKPAPVTKVRLQENKECWLCLTTQDLENHHIFEGIGRRFKSEQYGLTVWLCHNHHNENIPNNAGVHHDKAFDWILKQRAQKEFEKVYSRELFINEFGRNYL